MGGREKEKTEPKQLVSVGWREWVGLPDLSKYKFKAKIDTGALTSALHATHIEFDDRGGVSFVIHPFQRTAREAKTCHATLLEKRHVRSSTGHESKRPVIVTDLSVNGIIFPIELTLINRDDMGFRLLLGRRALRGRFQVDPGRSFLLGKPPKLP